MVLDNDHKIAYLRLYSVIFSLPDNNYYRKLLCCQTNYINLLSD